MTRKVDRNAEGIVKVLLPFAVGGAFLLNLVGVPGLLALGLAVTWFVGTGAAELALVRRSWHIAMRSLAAPVIFLATSVLTAYVGDSLIPPGWTTNKATMLVTNPRLMPSSKWCPQCGAEYLPQMTRCADCRVALVRENVHETRQAVIYDLAGWDDKRVYLFLNQLNERGIFRVARRAPGQGAATRA